MDETFGDQSALLPTKRIRNYSLEDLCNAIQAVNNGQMTAFGASKKFKIPRTTLLTKISKEHPKIPTKTLRLGSDLEARLADAVKTELQDGFRQQDVAQVAARVVQAMDISSPPPLHYYGDQNVELYGAESFVECHLGSPQKQSPIKPTLLPTEPMSLTNGVKMVSRPPNRLFIGRSSELQNLVSSLQRKRSGKQLLSVAVTGVPGIGKTELVLHAVLTLRAFFHHVIWVSVDNPMASFESAGRLLNLPPEKDLPKLVRAVFSCCSQFPCLIVYDDFHHGPDSLQEYLPQYGVDTSRLSIIITSQYNAWNTDVHLCLSGLEPESGLQLLRKGLPSEPLDVLEEISVRLNHIPLALQLVVAYKNLQESEKNPDDPFHFLQFSLHSNEREGYTRPLSRAFEQTLDLLDPVTRHILNVIAFSDVSSSCINLSLLRALKLSRLNQILQDLEKRSLIQRVNLVLKMFRIFKSIIRSKCENPRSVLNHICELHKIIR